MIFAFVRYEKDGWRGLEKTRWAKDTFANPIKDIIVEKNVDMRFEIVENLKENLAGVEFTTSSRKAKCTWCTEKKGNVRCKIPKFKKLVLCENCHNVVATIYEIYRTLKSEIGEFLIVGFDNDVEDECFADLQQMVETLVWELPNSASQKIEGG